MNLDDMSADDLKELNKSLSLIGRAAETLAALPASVEGGVRISLQPGGVAVLATAWMMPECREGGCTCAGDVGELVVDDLVVRGLEDLQRPILADGPPAAPAASPPETGESPEAIPRAEAPVGEVAPAAAPAGEPSCASNQLAQVWTEDDEALLIDLVAERLAAGDTRKAALEVGAAAIGRTPSASDLRLRSKLEERLQAAIENHRAERARRNAALERMAVAAAEKPAPVASAPPATPAPKPEAPAPSEEELTIAQRGILLSLRKLGGRKGFDPETDLEIVEGFARGTKAAVLALDLDLDSALMVSRFKDLTSVIRDDRGLLTINGQADLMQVLRHMVREARGVAA
ncbi:MULTISPECIES: hypothetical protein [Haematobacter]|mgnify:CR=1 FL=1|uniref:Uncharacterized protein n=1 Tax=Haematobacter massiliensis TaxID=195105 RepID=A0A086Y8T5_9RHOB|nr:MULTISPECIES: hypothetical protein [Haematobacter]KFI30685.1 hypothetical protein CN97_12750 [Haematobacter massiliensis]QBJ24896.1 hypothetical protein HmaOT1_11965 [Haematobacter massiliensis]